MIPMSFECWNYSRYQISTYKDNSEEFKIEQLVRGGATISKVMGLKKNTCSKKNLV